MWGRVLWGKILETKIGGISYGMGGSNKTRKRIYLNV